MNDTPSSTAFAPRQTGPAAAAAAGWGRLRAAVERALEAERAQLPLWTPIMLATGILAWFMLPLRTDWMVLICATLAGAAWLLTGPGARAGGRGARAAGLALLLIAAGCVLIWGKALMVGGPVLARPAVVTAPMLVGRVERLPARGIVRVTAQPEQRPDLPRRVRLNIDETRLPDGAIRAGDRLLIRARLMPPSPAALPGGYDYARRAWFEGIGATGRVLSTPVVLARSARDGPTLRERLADHVASRLPGREGAIAVTLATGDRGAITEADEEAMRTAGLSHLLSISGLHVTALIGAVVFLTFRLLALSTRLVLRWPLLLVAAATGAAAGIGYTLLTGAEVPTVRSCVSALLVMAGLALGREAISLRTLAAGALLVMLLWPEAVIGPSFQLSFTAVAVIVALYESPRIQRAFAARDEPAWVRPLRGLGALALTSFAVEAALAPIVLFHFHHNGLLGMVANMIAIPLTEFVVMPAEALALLLDLAGWGAPAWWVVGKALTLLLWLAHRVASVDSAIVFTPAIPAGAFALVIGGLYWCLLWRTPIRWAGVPILLAGLSGYALAPVPDLLVSSDGHHVAWRAPDRGMALLRPRAGEYMRDQLAEMAAASGPSTDLAQVPGARCSSEFCRLSLTNAGNRLTVLIARSRLQVPWRDLIDSCAAADIVIADRRLPAACAPRWVKLDRAELARRGGAAVHFASRDIERTRAARDDHPWAPRPLAKPAPLALRPSGDQLYRRSNPASLP